MVDEVKDEGKAHVEQEAHAAEAEAKKADEEVKAAVADALAPNAKGPEGAAVTPKSTPAASHAGQPEAAKPSVSSPASEGSNSPSIWPWVGIALAIAGIVIVKYFASSNS